MDNAESEICIAKTEFREAYNTGDLERLLAVYADSFIDLSEGQASFYGNEAKAALRWRAGNLFHENAAKVEVTIAEIVIDGSKAYDWGWHRLTLMPKTGGGAIVERFRYCEIWQKSPEGKWQISVFISNKDQSPEMLPDSVRV
jgi:ketosteroid isomerase-like protein